MADHVLKRTSKDYCEHKTYGEVVEDKAELLISDIAALHHEHGQIELIVILLLLSIGNEA